MIRVIVLCFCGLYELTGFCLGLKSSFPKACSGNKLPGSELLWSVCILSHLRETILIDKTFVASKIVFLLQHIEDIISLVSGLQSFWWKICSPLKCWLFVWCFLISFCSQIFFSLWLWSPPTRVCVRASARACLSVCHTQDQTLISSVFLSHVSPISFFLFSLRQGLSLCIALAILELTI